MASRKTKKPAGAAIQKKLKQAREEIKRLRAKLEQKAKARKKKPRKKRAPAESAIRQYKSKLGKVTHLSARESEGEPQYTWKELEELAAPELERRRKTRWARLVVEIDKGSLLHPSQYRRLRGKPIIRTNWHPAHELLGKAVGVVDQLQRSGAVTPRMKVIVVEARKRPPGRVF